MPLSDTPAPPTPGALAGIGHADLLQTLARADQAAICALAEEVLIALGTPEVLANRTGLVMLPMRDTAGGTNFHLGEVLVSEAHIRAQGHEGYGMRRGRDLEAAMAMAVLDLAVACGVAHGPIAAFVTAEAKAQAAEDTTTLRAIEATRVDMETF